jgi:2,3-bisphosphoglycerate-independent phosphoglycerate mutase
MKKIILVVIDGLADSPVPKLGNKTPLEAARTPNMDSLMRSGDCGLVSPFWFKSQKYPCSDTAHLALLGYDPRSYYLGRGPYEVAGIGLDLKEGDVALRANFGTVSEDLRIIDRRAGRIRETMPLIKSIQGISVKGIKFIIKKSYGHRAGLIMRGKNLSSSISDGDPHEPGAEISKVVPLDKSRRSAFTAEALNLYLEKTHNILKECSLNKQRRKQGKLEANYLLVRGAGKMKKTPSFKKKHGLKAACIAGGGLYKGIGKILGMDVVEVKGATGLPNTDLKRKFLTAKSLLKKYDFIFCHIKAPDNFAEDGDFAGKKRFIEKIDMNMKPLLELSHALVALTGDHATCSLLKRHCLELVPFFISGSGENGKKGKFSESGCRNGKLGKIRQIKLMSVIKKYASKIEK